MDISTNHEGYNKFVQAIQASAMEWGLQTGFESVGIYSMFYVIVNDKKWFLAREVPFALGGDRDARISPDEWAKLTCHLSSSAHDVYGGAALTQTLP